MDKVISNRMLRLTILALQETAGAQCKSILTNSGWDQYLITLPPENDEMVASMDNFLRMGQTVYAMLGEDLYRLYERNTGQRMADGMVQGTWAQSLRAQGPGIPADQRLAWFVREFVTGMRQTGVEYTVTEDATAWYLTWENCLGCVAIRNARQPLCSGAAVFIRKLGEAATGRKLRVVEVTCRATGAPDCRYAITK